MRLRQRRAAARRHRDIIISPGSEKSGRAFGESPRAVELAFIVAKLIAVSAAIEVAWPKLVCERAAFQARLIIAVERPACEP